MFKLSPAKRKAGFPLRRLRFPLAAGRKADNGRGNIRQDFRRDFWRDFRMDSFQQCPIAGARYLADILPKQAGMIQCPLLCYHSRPVLLCIHSNKCRALTGFRAWFAPRICGQTSKSFSPRKLFLTFFLLFSKPLNPKSLQPKFSSLFNVFQQSLTVIHDRILCQLKLV